MTLRTPLTQQFFLAGMSHRSEQRDKETRFCKNHPHQDGELQEEEEVQRR